MLLTAFGLVVLLGPGGRFFDQPLSAAQGGAAIAGPAAACGAQAPPSDSPKLYKEAPAPKLDPAVDYWAVVHTSCGDMKIDLLEDQAPHSVNSFVFLAREGFYDGLTWHLVRYGYIIQTGDPNGQNGAAPDDAGYTIPDELPKSPDAYSYGGVGLANRGPNTGGSQFFIVAHDLQGALGGKPKPLEIEPKYTIFGRVPKRFFGSIEAIAKQPIRGGQDPIEAVKPATDVYIERIEIVEKKRPAR